MKEVKVEVMGPEPPCARCQSVKRAVDKVAQEFARNGIWVDVERIARKNREVENRDCIRSRIMDLQREFRVALRNLGEIPLSERLDHLTNNLVRKERKVWKQQKST